MTRSPALWKPIHMWRLGSPPDLSPDLQAMVRAQQVGAVVRLTAPLMLVNVVNVTTFVGILYLMGQLGWVALGWAVTVKVVALPPLVRGAMGGGRTHPDRVSRGAIRRVVRSAILFGLLWGAGGLFVLPELDGIAQVFAAGLLVGMATGGVIALYPVPAAGSAYFGLVMVGIVGGLMRTGAPLGVAVGAVAIGAMFLVIFSQVIGRFADTFVAEFVGRRQLEERNRLIAELLEQAESEARGEKRRSEARLAQAKKMEAIGQLTGGIAHDFNNLLAAIQGHAELIAEEDKADRALVEPIIGASSRGADLIQRLLSVARKQTLRPRPVKLSRLIEELVILLRRTIGPQIAIETDIGPETWPASVDPGQLEGALLNLALNARDAMPQGGTLSILVKNRADGSARLRALGLAGRFVEIAVRDTGMGMEPEVRERALDPFYTTKKFGLGSGLGLSTVAGFAEQSGGGLEIVSASGAGTTVSIYLPPAEGEAAPILDRKVEAEAPAKGRGETIVLVEDADDVRAMTARMLQSIGYEVRGVATASAALETLAEDGAVDLILTDVLLPGGMNGFELAGAVADIAPRLPVAFLSGFNHADGPGAVILGKPFTRHELAAHVEAALGRKEKMSAPGETAES